MNKKLDPSTCPYCGSSDIIGNQVDIEYESAYQACACEACEAAWSECYDMTRRMNDNGDTIQRKECVIIGDLTDSHFIERQINSLLRSHPEIKPHIDIQTQRVNKTGTPQTHDHTHRMQEHDRVLADKCTDDTLARRTVGGAAYLLGFNSGYVQALVDMRDKLDNVLGGEAE